MMFWIPGKNLATRWAAKVGITETFRWVDQRLIIRPDCGE
jgi:hypothetical protein